MKWAFQQSSHQRTGDFRTVLSECHRTCFWWQVCSCKQPTKLAQILAHTNDRFASWMKNNVVFLCSVEWELGIPAEIPRVANDWHEPAESRPLWADSTSQHVSGMWSLSEHLSGVHSSSAALTGADRVLECVINLQVHYITLLALWHPFAVLCRIY